MSIAYDDGLMSRVRDSPLSRPDCGNAESFRRGSPFGIRAVLKAHPAAGSIRRAYWFSAPAVRIGCRATLSGRHNAGLLAIARPSIALAVILRIDQGRNQHIFPAAALAAQWHVADAAKIIHRQVDVEERVQPNECVFRLQQQRFKAHLEVRQATILEEAEIRMRDAVIVILRKPKTLDVTTLVGGNPCLQVIASQYEKGCSLEVEHLCPDSNGPSQARIFPKPWPVRFAAREEVPIRLRIQTG